MTSAPRLVDAVEDFLVDLSAAKPSPHTLAAYRRDLLGVAARMAAAHGVGLDELPLAALDKASLRRGFAAWAADHAKASTIRAWSAWNAFFRHLVADDLVEGNPMDGVGKPRRPSAPVKVIRGPDVTAKLLGAAATTDVRARHAWPERDTALVATLAITGVRLGEAVALTVGSLDGPPGERRLWVVGKGDKARVVPIYPALESVLGAYLDSRTGRFPGHDLARPATPLFVHHSGTRSPPARSSTSSSVCTCGPGSELRSPLGRWSTPCAIPSPPPRSRAGPTSSRSSSCSATPPSTPPGATSRPPPTSSATPCGPIRATSRSSTTSRRARGLTRRPLSPTVRADLLAAPPPDSPARWRSRPYPWT